MVFELGDCVQGHMWKVMIRERIIFKERGNGDDPKTRSRDLFHVSVGSITHVGAKQIKKVDNELTLKL